jgi:hypothetical protein
MLKELRNLRIEGFLSVHIHPAGGDREWLCYSSVVERFYKYLYDFYD